MARQKAETHSAILASASVLLRVRGIRNSSIADVMAGAKRTVGGFYAHFRSKEELFGAVLERAALERASLLATAGGDTNSRLLRLMQHYLTPEHRDGAAEGCPLPSTVPDVSRGPAPLRRALARVVEHLLDGAQATEPGSPERERALAVLALSYGGLSFARALRGTPLSDEMLAACAAVGRRCLEATRADEPGREKVR